jgi:hypothetical protein
MAVKHVNLEELVDARGRLMLRGDVVTVIRHRAWMNAQREVLDTIR